MKGRLQYLFNTVILLFFTACVFYITVFSRDAGLVHNTELVPFWSVKEYIDGNHSFFYTFVLNVFLFIPLGYLFAALVRQHGDKHSVVLPAIVCLGISVVIEAVQFVTYRGVCDADDLIGNFFGAVIGAVLFRFADKFYDPVKLVILLIFVIAGVAGCLLATDHESKSYVRDFAFDITEVGQNEDEIVLSGYCYVYDASTPGYRIVLKNEATGREITAETEAAGNEFTATAALESGEAYTASAEGDPVQKYAIYVDFDLRPLISTKVYIRNNTVEYVDGDVPPISAPGMEDVTGSGILKEYHAAEDAYIYQYKGRIYWLIGKELPPDTEIIYQIYTNEPEKLPAERQTYMFDNRGLSSNDKNTRYYGKYRVFSADIPTDYTITGIVTGFSTDGEISWMDCFRLASES